MFDKLKQLQKLKDIQQILKQERIEVEKDGTKIVINGGLEIELIQLNPLLDKEKQEKILKDCFNEALKKINVSIAQKVSKMSGFGL